MGRGCSWGSASSSVTVVEAQRRPLLPLLPLPLLPWGDSCCCCCIAAPLRPAASGFPALREWKLRKRKKKKKITALPSARRPAQSLLSPPPRGCEAPQLRPLERRGRQAGAGPRGGAQAASGLTPGRVRWRRGSVAPPPCPLCPVRVPPRSPPIHRHSAHSRGNAARLLETGGDLGGLWGWGSRS